MINWVSTSSLLPGGVFEVAILEMRPGFVMLSVDGPDLDRLFEHESGGHRWQRVPPTEKRGRVQTSTITVAVLPDATEEEVPLKDSDLEWKATRGSGAGGQARNKLSTAVQLWHKPSGLMVRCETERSQLSNRKEALRILRAKLKAIKENSEHAKISTDRRQQVGSGMRGDKRRTIRVRDGSVKDHITGRTWRYDDYVSGNW